MLLRLKLSTVCRTFGLISLFFVASCATNNDPTTNWSVEKLHKEAKDELSSGAYDKAIGYYEKLEGRAAGTPLAPPALFFFRASAAFAVATRCSESATRAALR